MRDTLASTGTLVRWLLGLGTAAKHQPSVAFERFPEGVDIELGVNLGSRDAGVIKSFPDQLQIVSLAG